MTEHRRFLELAAASVDFGLTADEQHALRTHLVVCDACSVTVRGILDDASRLAAAPHPAAPVAVRDAVIRASAGRSSRGAPMRWPLVAAMFAVLLVAGSFVVGSVVLRQQGTLPAPTLPAAADRATAEPSRTPRYAPGWNDLGTITDQFGGRTVTSVMPGPDGGLIAFGLDRTTTDAVVWLSEDGRRWTEASQPQGVFGGGGAVPTTGALGGPGITVVGWATSTEGRQRAIWSSSDGWAWSRTADLGVASEDLTMAAGPAGMVVWAPSGRTWVSDDGDVWRSTNIGRAGVTDVAVDDEGFVAVGGSGSIAFLVSSDDGRDWGSPQEASAATGSEVGIERSMDGVEAVWIGEQRWRRSGSTWRAVQDASVPRVPDPESVVGGREGLVAVGAPTSAGAYRAWTWDGSGDWEPWRVDAEAGSGTPAVVGVAPLDAGWFVLTRRGGALDGWFVQP